MRLPFLPAAVAAVLFAFGGSGDSLRAATLAQFTGGSGSSAQAFFGQSFTVGGSGSFNNIVFDFLDLNSQTTYATGTAYLLSMAYGGSPSALSTLTPGFLGSVAASGGFYDFASDVVLQSGTMYFLYTDKRAALGAFTGGGLYSGGQDYLAITAGGAYSPGGVSSDFRVTGSAVTPEPATWVLLLSGCLGVACKSRRHGYLGRDSSVPVR